MTDRFTAHGNSFVATGALNRGARFGTDVTDALKAFLKDNPGARKVRVCGFELRPSMWGGFVIHRTDDGVTFSGRTLNIFKDR
jgi:hypothetical protein